MKHSSKNQSVRLKKLTALLLCLFALPALSACGNKGTDITVVSREDSSGTRGAFIELFGIEQKNEAGEKVDRTTLEAQITNSTAVMMTTVAGNKNAIGYVSLGSLSADAGVKAMAIDGAAATVENIGNGSYKVCRPFNIATTDTMSDIAADFISFVLSAEGQAVVTDKGYITVGDPQPYTGSMTSGKLVIAGSSSVTPLMEALREAYLALNPNTSIEVQQSDSTSGMTSTLEGICDIGMASRALKESELAGGLTGTVIAQDGIAVICHPDNAVDELTSEQVRQIYTGEVTVWDDLN